MPKHQEAFAVRSTEQDERVVHLDLLGELDLMTAPLMQEAIDAATANGHKRLEIDLAELSFIDSTGLHLLVEAHKRMVAKHGESVVVATPPHVAKVFEIMGLDRVLNLVPQA